MNLSREASLVISWILNELIPPWIRDQRWFGWMLMKLLYKDRAAMLMRFDSRAFEMSDADFAGIYAATRPPPIKRETDLNHACLERVLTHAVGPNVLDAGCGEGFLARCLAKRFAVTAVDFVVDPKLVAENPKITFRSGNIEALPYPDEAFDTAVCTHVLEHVRNIQAALAELRRVTRRRLIIVVPKERPHRYAPSLHLHFFPYSFSVQAVFGCRPGATLEDAGGDWFYCEDKTPEEVLIDPPARETFSEVAALTQR